MASLFKKNGDLSLSANRQHSSTMRLLTANSQLNTGVEKVSDESPSQNRRITEKNKKKQPSFMECFRQGNIKLTVNKEHTGCFRRPTIPNIDTNMEDHCCSTEQASSTVDLVRKVKQPVVEQSVTPKEYKLPEGTDNSFELVTKIDQPSSSNEVTSSCCGGRFDSGSISKENDD